MAQFSLQMGDVSHMNLVLCVACGQAELNTACNESTVR